MTDPVHILYVDDESSLLEIGKIYLERIGNFFVDTTTSPADALNMLSRISFDAIISDYEMPDMNGIELLKAVRRMDRDFPFILFTGRGRESVVIEALNAGADFYIQKGGDPKSQFTELAHKITQSVSLRKTESSLQKTVEELRKSTCRYETLITASNTGAWEYHMDSGFLWCSPEYFSMLGRDIHDYDMSGQRNIEETWNNLLYPDDLNQALLNLEAYMENFEGMYEQYFRMQHKEGHFVWIWSRGKLIRDAEGNPSSVIVGTHIDVTERKQHEAEILRSHQDLQVAYDVISATGEELRANLDKLSLNEQALRESEIKFKTLFESAGDAIIILDNAIITDCNKRTEEIFKRPRDQIIGHSPVEFSPLLQSDGDFSSEKMQKYIHGAYLGEPIFFEWVHSHPDGNLFICEITLRRILVNDNWFLQAIVRDVTERKKTENELLRKNEELHAAYEEISANEEDLRTNQNALLRHEQELRETKNELVNIINFLPDATWVINRDGVVIAWNHAIEELTRIPAEEMIGQGNYAYALPFYQERRPILIDLILHYDPTIAAKYSSIQRKGEFLFSEVFLPHFSQGKGMYFWFTACPLYDTEGNLTGAIESIRDITDRKKVEETLKEDDFHRETLLKFYQMDSSSLQELMNFALEKSGEFTRSPLGYLAIVSDDESLLTMYAWSAQAMHECSIREKPIQYPVTSTGLWGEAIRQRRPVITNAYAEENSLKKGYPKGHVPLIRHMNIPVFDKDQIVMVVGVGNKPTGYDERDVRVLTLLMNGLWTVIKQRRTEEELIRKSEEIQTAYQQIVAVEKELRLNLFSLTQQEAELKVHEERLLKSQEISKTGSWEYSLYDGKIWGSAEFKRIFGLSPEIREFTSDDISAGILEKDLVNQALTALVDHGEEYDIEYHIHPVAGSAKKLVHSVAWIQRDPKTNQQKVMGIIQDITKRKQSELALQASEQKFSSLFMHMAEGVAIHELTYDAKGNPEDYLIVNTNPAFETHLGISKDAVVLKTSKEAYGVSEPPYFDIYSHVAMTGEPYRFETFFPPLNKYFAISVYCPGIGSFATIFEDITTRKRADIECEDLIAELEKTNEKLGAAYEELSGSEEELRHQYQTLAYTEENLRKSTDLLENLIAIANVPIIIWDPSFRIIRMNHAFETLIGRSSDEVIGHSLEFLFPPDQAEHSMRLFLTTMEGVRWETVEIDIQHKDESIRTLLWNSATLYTPDGLNPVASIAQGHDISGERRLEREKDAALLQIQQNLSYLAILNDEIRNPLMIILTLADMLDDEKVFTEINLQARRIDSMVSQLDKRWIESEKVLNAIRKHYQIQAAKPEQNLISVDVCAPVSNRKFLIEEVQAQLYTILDSIDALVYVADMETYEVLFINKKGRAWFGDPAGLKCYQYLQKDPDGPCPYCTNHLLVDEFGPTGVKHGEHQNTRTGWWFDCRDRAIRWSDGRLVKLEIATDITHRRQAEEALREKTEELDQYFSTCLDLFSIADTDGYFRHLNPEWEKTLGYQLNELEGSRFLDYVHPDDVPATLATLGDLGNKNEVLNFTNRYRHKNGTYRWIEWRASPSPQNNKIYASARDITERKLAEEALLESKRRYVNLYRYAQVGLFETSLKEGTVVACNERYAALAGFSSIEEAIGQDVIHLYVNPEDRKDISRILHEQGHIDDYILQLKKHLTGQPFWAQFSARINLAEDIAEGTIIDITELKLIEQALRESESQFRSYIDKSPEGTFLASENGEFLFMNAAGCTMTGFPLAELLKKNLADIIHPDDRERARDHFLQVVHEGNSSGEFRFITHNGDIRSWVVYTFRLSQTRILGFTRDITEQKQAEEALRESNRKLRLLTGLTRHDIYNHISAIQILLEMALSSSDLTKIHTYITRTQEAGSKIEATIGFTREYENFGIVSSGWQKIHPIIESAKMEISLHGITIDNLVPQDIEVYADPIIRKVFATLMDNAVRHGGDITHIRFLCYEGIHELLIICENDGDSIPQKEKDRIFDHGFGKNTGIGLFISKEILSITGLSIRECGADGEGVRFEISVPEGKFRRTGLTNPLR